MHAFTDLIDHSTTFTLNALKEVNEKIIDALQTSGATSLVKGLQMVQLQKAIFAVGMFSMFEAILHDGLTSKDGFVAANAILDSEGEADLKERFNNLCSAINVLKHGRGRSYDALVSKATALPFRIKLPDEPFFFEGDVSEVSTLVEVDDTFVIGCADVIRDVSKVIRRARPDFSF
jgi:hypothetical protein